MAELRRVPIVFIYTLTHALYMFWHMCEISFMSLTIFTGYYIACYGAGVIEYRTAGYAEERPY